MGITYSHIEIITILFNLTLGYAVWTYNSKSRLNRILTFLIVCILLIDIGHLLSLETYGMKFSQASVTLGSLGISFFFPFLYTLSLYYPVKREFQRKLPYALYGVTSVLAFSVILSIRHFEPYRSGGYFPGAENAIPIVFIVFYFLLTCFSLALLFFTTRNFLQSLKKDIIPYEKKTIRLLIAVGLPLSYALSVVVWMDFFFAIPFPLVSLLLALFTAFTVALIFRFRVVDLKRLVDRIFFFPSITAILVFFYTSTILSNQSRIAQHLSLPLNITLILEVIIIYMAVSTLRRLMDIPFFKSKFSNIFRFRSLHIEPFEHLSYAVNMEDLFKRLKAAFWEYDKIENLMLLLFEKGSRSFVSVDRERPFALSGDSPLIPVIEKLNRGVTLEELLTYVNDRDDILLLYSHGIDLLLPIRRGAQVTALLLLPRRGFFRRWSYEDIASLNYLRVIIPSLLDRCVMYETERALEKHEYRMEQLNVIGQMASELAHEIRNPLSIISTSVETILRNRTREKDKKKMLQFIQEEAQRINVLANKLLNINFFKKPEFDSVNLAAILERLRDFLQYKLKDRNITLSILADDPFLLRSDSNVLFQILLNVVINSIEAMDEGGEIGISCARENSSVSILLRDNGPGIQKEIREKIFEPFFTTKRNGSGLGLAVSRKLAENIFGSIELVSTDSGACFKVTLPVMNGKE
jgi:signal transduction histidine kinase